MPIPEDMAELRAAFIDAKERWSACEAETIEFEWLNVNEQGGEWEGEYGIEADISRLLSKWGKGVYTFEMYDTDKKVAFFKHSIFHGIIPPTGYNPAR